MGLSRTAYVNLLKSQAGYHEGRDPSGNWNNIQKFSPAVPGLEWSQGQAWCATFTAWGADELGARDFWPITASCWTAVQFWKKAGRWTEYPVLGGPFYMGNVGEDHVGVVYAYDADSIYTVEGNTNSGGGYQGDGVYLRVRPRRGANSPYGYGVPAFDEGTTSADPALGGTPAASVAAPAPPRPSVSLAHVVAAARRDPGLRQGGTTYPAEVNVVEVALAAEGLLSDAYAHDGSFGSLTVTAYAKWQRRRGFNGADADGIPGKATLTALGAAHGFTVTA
ncbi:peptidoglycan-binding protein [Streptomyces sp. NPDC002467]|uniref:peptidoglycan-binding protein n=1 Tax=Streptomyces sp. NPDC002467 TaxID=3364647 RepID=UPI0036D0B937